MSERRGVVALIAVGPLMLLCACQIATVAGGQGVAVQLSRRLCPRCPQVLAMIRQVLLQLSGLLTLLTQWFERSLNRMMRNQS